MTEVNASHAGSNSDRNAWRLSGQTYNWPASRLVWANMRKLTRLSNYLKQPINQVLVDAVEAYAAAILAILPDSIPPLDKAEIELIESGHMVWQAEAMPDSNLANQDERIQLLADEIVQLSSHIEVLEAGISELRVQMQNLVNSKTCEQTQSKATIPLPHRAPAHDSKVAEPTSRKPRQPELF